MPAKAFSDRTAPVAGKSTAGAAEGLRDECDRVTIPVLRAIVEGRPIGTADLDALAAAASRDPVRSAFLPAGAASPSRDDAFQEASALRSLWEPFAQWWRSYFPAAADLDGPLADLWRLYAPFAQWILEQRREHRPGGLFMVGFNGSPGAGKTVLTNAVATVLNQLLDPAEDGRAVARSGDDWYLGRRDREPLRDLGYEPGSPEVPNRSLPGTHDIPWLKRNLREMETSTSGSVVRMGDFDKRADEQRPGPGFEVHGRIAVFLFDLWFAGADTGPDVARAQPGLRREVAKRLADWREVFERFDALWAYSWPPFEQMVRERVAQERSAAARGAAGARGMSEDDIRTFMAYMVEKGWDPGTTSPVPPDRAVSFHARRDSAHRVVTVRKGDPTK